jgi:hypothetical protein
MASSNKHSGLVQKIVNYGRKSFTKWAQYNYVNIVQQKLNEYIDFTVVKTSSTSA